MGRPKEKAVKGRGKGKGETEGEVKKKGRKGKIEK
jgi:hypothetical protein